MGLQELNLDRTCDNKGMRLMINHEELEPDEIARLAGSKFEYRYRELPKSGATAVQKYIKQTRKLAGPVARSFNDTLNAEWFIRSYLALKLVLSSTLLANTAVYARNQNLQATRPYLSYYLMLNCCRAFIFSLPCTEWQGLTTIEMTHSKILNIAIDKIKRLDKKLAPHCDKILRAAQEQRELFSYRFPASGLSLFGEDLVDLDEAIDLARLFTELTQLNFACLEGEVRKNASSALTIADIDDIWYTFQYGKRWGGLIDDDDYFRVGQFHRKYRGPVALVAIAKEGLVEDFFGAWYDEDATGFNPDDNNNLLLDLF